MNKHKTVKCSPELASVVHMCDKYDSSCCILQPFIPNSFPEILYSLSDDIHENSEIVSNIKSIEDNMPYEDIVKIRTAVYLAEANSYVNFYMAYDQYDDVEIKSYTGDSYKLPVADTICGYIWGEVINELLNNDTVNKYPDLYKIILSLKHDESQMQGTNTIMTNVENDLTNLD